MASKNFDPLQWLPYELWVRFVEHYACGQPEGPLPLLDVSRSWQTNLFTTPFIWTEIHFDGGHDEQCRAECFFWYSKSLLVDLVIGKNSAALETALKYRDRIQSLTFRAKWPDAYHTSDISRLSSKLAGYIYPNLIHMCVDSPRDDVVVIPQSLLEACPALIGRHGAYIEQETIPYMMPSITMSGVIGNGLGLINGLEGLRLLYLPSQRENLDNSDHFRIPGTRLERLELSAERYSRNIFESPEDRNQPFYEDVCYLHLLREFASSTHRALKVLVITMPWHEFDRLIPCLSDCTALRELALQLDFSRDPSQPWDVSAVSVEEFGHIRKVLISAMSKPLPERHSASNERRIIRALVEGGALEYLEELNLILNSPLVPGSQIPDLLRTTTNLRKLSLAGCDVARPYDFDKVILPRLHTLVLDRGSHMEYLELPEITSLTTRYPNDCGRMALSLLSSGNLASLTTETNVLFDCNDFIAAEIGDKKLFEGLLTLNLLPVGLTATPTYHLDLSNLQSLYFEESGSTILTQEGKRGSSLDHFMLEILFSPSNCPRLHTIGAKRYPNWALAVAMFHRRNSLGTVTPITSLWLLGYPHVAILMKMVGALNAVDEPPDRSIITAAWFDRVIKQRWKNIFWRGKACQDCIMCGYVKCLSDDLQDRLYPSDDPTIMELYPMKAETNTLSLLNFDEWKYYLQETAFLWDTRQDTPTKHRCSRHNKQNMVHIGPGTLAGVMYDAF